MWRNGFAFRTLAATGRRASSRPVITHECSFLRSNNNLHPSIILGWSRKPDFNNTDQLRTYSSGRYRKQRPSSRKKRSPAIFDPRIQARPPGEKEFVSKFKLPDKEKEQQLGRLQTQFIDHHKKGQYQKGLEVGRRLLEETIEHFGREHPAVAAAYNNTGLMHKHLGDFDKSRSDYQAALKIYKTAVGTDHASYASCLHNLGNLNRTQIHFDGDLSATDRLSLVESALEYLETAHGIRFDELGREHPHTVASRSSWGATLSAQILHHHKMTERIKDTGDLSRKRFYEAILPKDAPGWDVAEEHLRKALQTAIENPRGPSIAKTEPQQRGGKKKLPKKPDDKPLGPQTLSAAAAAQNLAVFLKMRATTVQPHNTEWLKEAQQLYHKVLAVQSELLPGDKHPDMYTTKHNLAELLTAMGDEEAANVLRQEIIDTYDSPESKTAETEEKNNTLVAAESK